MLCADVCAVRRLAPVTPEPSKDYLTSYAEREARERLQQRLTPRPSPSQSTAIQPRETTLVLKAWVRRLPVACTLQSGRQLRFQLHGGLALSHWMHCPLARGDHGLTPWVSHIMHACMLQSGFLCVVLRPMLPCPWIFPALGLCSLPVSRSSEQCRTWDGIALGSQFASSTDVVTLLHLLLQVT